MTGSWSYLLDSSAASSSLCPSRGPLSAATNHPLTRVSYIYTKNRGPLYLYLSYIVSVVSRYVVTITANYRSLLVVNNSRNTAATAPGQPGLVQPYRNYSNEVIALGVVYMYSEIHVGMIFEGSLVLSLPYTGARNCCGQLCCPVYSSYTCDYLSVLYTCTLAKLFICIFPAIIQVVLLSWFSKHEKKIYSITWTSFLSNFFFCCLCIHVVFPFYWLSAELLIKVCHWL